MNTMRNCPSCGNPLPLDAPGGLCPVCLLKTDSAAEPAIRGPAGKPLSTVPVLPLAQGGSAEPASTLKVDLTGPRVRYLGDYELEEEIGRGGMGVVYRARQLSLDRPVAVKMILAGQLASGAEVRRFHVEAEAAANLQHANIVAIHEIGQHEGQHFFSMDLVDGSSLAARLKGGPLPVGEATRLARIMAEAVQYAHQHGVLHRDLKPANVLLDAAGQPHLTDFGLAKRVDRDQNLTGSGAVFGTPSYMPPEQAAGRQDLVGPASDTYALGAMLYEMLTGQPPFRGASVAETVSQVIDSAPTPPSRLNPRVPRDLETICLKCLEKRPDLRYATANLLAQDLERFLDHEPIQARPSSRGRSISRWFVRRPMILAGLASVVALGLLWTAYGLWAENRFLTWEAAHPGEMEPASRWLGFTRYLLFFAWLVAFGFEGLVRKRIRRRVLTGYFVPQQVLWGFGLPGLIGIAVGIYLGTTVIQDWLDAPRALPKLRSAMAAANNPTLRAATQRDVKEAQKAAGRWALWSGLLLAGITVWCSGAVIVKVWREHSFVLYCSADEEQAARAQAVAQIESETKERERKAKKGQTPGWLVLVMLTWVPLMSYLSRKSGYGGELGIWFFLAAASGAVGGLLACAPRGAGLRVRGARGPLALLPILTPHGTRGPLVLLCICTAGAALLPNAARRVTPMLIVLLASAALGVGLGRFLHWRSRHGRV